MRRKARASPDGQKLVSRWVTKSPVSRTRQSAMCASGRGEEVPHDHGAAVVVHPVGGVAVRVGEVEQAGAAVPVVGVVVEEVPPEDRTAQDGARGADGPPGVDLGRMGAGLVRRDHPDAAGVRGLRAERREAPVDADPPRLGGDAVAVAAVEGALARGERGDRRGHRRDLRLHERPEHAAAAVRGQHGHPGHALDVHLPAGDTHRERHCARDADELAVDLREEEAIHVQQPPHGRGPGRGVGGAEAALVLGDQGVEVGIGGAAHGEAHGRRVWRVERVVASGFPRRVRAHVSCSQCCPDRAESTQTAIKPR
nr:hypothetical protein [Pseudonocardia pini]